MSNKGNCVTPEKQPVLRGKPAKAETSPFSLFAKELPPITPPEPPPVSGSVAYPQQRSPLSLRQDTSNCSWMRHSQGSDTERSVSDHHIRKESSPHDVSVAMLFGSPLPHMPSSLQDPSTAHLSLSPNRGISQSGAFSPSPFHTLFQSPSGATLDDSPYQSLSHSPAKHSPVSAAAQHTAAQASRQAAAGHAQGQRSEQPTTTRAMDSAEHASTGLLVPVPAPAALETDPQVTYASTDRGFAERMPSLTSLMTVPPQKRQRCLRFQTGSDQETSSQAYSQQSPSASISQQESQSSPDQPTRPPSQSVSASQSDQAEGPSSHDNDTSKHAAVQQDQALVGSGRQVAQVRASSRQPPASAATLPALAAAMGAHMPSTARSAASHAAASAAAVTPVTSRYVSSHSGDQASHQSVLHPDTPGDAVPAVSEKRLSTSSTRYRRVQSAASGGPKRCNCKKSKCLKLYCDCFAAGVYCQNCSCSCCMNTEENKDLIVVTREQITQRNPQAFDTKISKHRVAGPDGTPGQHLRGCNCKKSHCRKKYCECFQAGVPCGPQCKCCDCHNCAPGSRGGPPRPPPSHPTGPPTAAQQAAHGQGPNKTSPGTPAVRAAEAVAVQRPASRANPGGVSAAHSIKREDDRATPMPPTRRRDPRNFRKRVHQLHSDEPGTQMDQTAPGERGEGVWGGLSRSMSEGSAWQAHAKSPSAQVVGDAVRVDTALPISPLDPRQGRIKQEDTRELRSAHSSGEADYQGSQEQYTYKRQDISVPFSGSYSQLLTGPASNSLVLVPCKNQSEQDSSKGKRARHAESEGYDALEPTPPGGGAAAPEPYQILMPVQMADGQMMALPADQAQFAPGTLFVPHSTAPAHLEMTGMQYAVHSSDAEQQLHGQSHMHHYMPDDSMLFQHYADMDVGQPGGLRNLLQTEPHATPPSKFGLDKAIGGDQLLLPHDMDTDLEQLIKGGPFELSLAADRLGNNLFGINAGAQSGAMFSPPPLPWQAVAHEEHRHQQHQHQQMMTSPMLQQHSMHQVTDEGTPLSSFQLHRARRAPTGASSGNRGSPSHDAAVRKPTVASRSSATSSHLLRPSVSADLERTELCNTAMAYPASPNEQQAWANMSKMPPQQAATGFVRLNSGIKTVFSPHQ